MKLSFCFTVFGTELLKESIKQIYDHVDNVIICWQRVSNNGIEDKHLFGNLQLLKGKKIWLSEYIPDLKHSTKKNERRKHQQMIDVARGIGSTHFVMAATDHFYEPVQFEYGKQKAMDYDVTFTEMFTYYKHPTWQLTPIEDYYMPFICRLHPDTEIINTPKYPLRVDPSVRVAPFDKWYLFKQQEVMLHHFGMVRQDLKAKFVTAASPKWTAGLMEGYIDEYENYDIVKNVGVSYFKGRKIKEVENIFGL